MLCITLQKFTQACGGITGGVSNIAVFDPDDINFTQAADVAGVKQPYTALALRAGAETAKVYGVTFVRDEAEWAWKQSVKGCSVKYEHTLTFQLAQNQQALTTFLQALDAAACCCGLGLAIRTNDGKVFIAGEKWVNAAEIARFTMTHNGSSGTSGKLYDDFNGGTIVLTGPYSRNLFEYTGGWDDFTALLA